MSNNHVEKRIDRLEQHLRESAYETTAKSVSDHSFYSYRHANRLFTLHKGESISSFGNKIKLQKAAEYLKYSAKSVFDIAIDVGYQSIASFSKAFKKLYGLPPTAFRASYKQQNTSILQTTGAQPYTIARLNYANLQAKKVTFNVNITFNDFYVAAKNAFHALNATEGQFIFMWDEDPDLCQLPESRFFIGLQGAALGTLNDTPPTTAGRYAIFNTVVFKGIEYDDWHKLAFLLLEQDGVDMRESTYVEYFTNESLAQLNTFYPYKIALPIE